MFFLLILKCYFTLYLRCAVYMFMCKINNIIALQKKKKSNG